MNAAAKAVASEVRQKVAPSAKKIADAELNLRRLGRVTDAVAREMARPLVTGDLVLNTYGARAAAIPYNLADDAEAGLDMLREAFGEDYQIADDLGVKIPLWRWADEVARLQIELLPWRQALADWLKHEAARQQAYRILENKIEKRDGASRREREKQLQIDRLQRAREAKERADRMLAEAEAAAQG